MKKIVLFSLAILSTISGCNKSSSDLDDSTTTLQEFFSSLPTGGYKLSKNLPIIDNSNLEEKFLNKRLSNYKKDSSKALLWQEQKIDDLEKAAKLKFRWPGIDRYGNPCNAFVGVCLTIPIGAPEQLVPRLAYNGTDPSSILTIAYDKLIVEPIAKENGLTSDGYLPIPDYMPISEKLLIKPGIYKGRPDMIILDLVKSN